MTEIWVLEGPWVVPGIAPSQVPQSRTTPGTPLPRTPVPCPRRHHARQYYGGVNMAVGLKSVQQLTLCAQISGFQGFTEVYNLPKIGRINNHFTIPGFEKAGVSNPWTGPLLSQQWSMKPQISPILDYGISEVGDMEIWRPSRDQSGRSSWRSILRSI